MDRVKSCGVNTWRTGVQRWRWSTECKITAGHWPISNHFSKMANQNFSMVHSLCTHGQSNCKNWKMADHFKFLILHSGPSTKWPLAPLRPNYFCHCDTSNAIIHDGWPVRGFEIYESDKLTYKLTWYFLTHGGDEIYKIIRSGILFEIPCSMTLHEKKLIAREQETL